MTDHARDAADDTVEDLLERLRTVPVANVADVMDRISATDSGIRPMWPGARIVARAFSIVTRSGDNLAIHEALAHVAPGEVVVVNGFADTSRALVGELIAGRARARGVAGFVIDGAIRDADAIFDLRLPVFARAVTPAGPYKLGPYRLQVPVALGGQCVMPGDVIVADADGVAVVPFAQLADVVAAAEDLQRAEVLKRAAIEESLAARRP